MSKPFHPSHPFQSYTILLLSCIVLTLLLNGCGKKTVTPKVPQAEQLSPAVAGWYTMMEKYRSAPELQKLRATNDFFNKLEYVDDILLWQKQDYWASPYEMLEKGAGDCEDFAIAKYLTLRQIDVDEEKLRITYVIAVRKKNIPHMVLNYYSYPAAVPLVLDSLHPAILPASQRTDLLPVYSFNGQDLWLAKKARSEKVRSAEGLSLWQEVLERFNTQAIASPLPQ